MPSEHGDDKNSAWMAFDAARKAPSRVTTRLAASVACVHE